MPYMDTCVYCGKKGSLAAWKRGDKVVRVCGSAECRQKARVAGFKRL